MKKILFLSILFFSCFVIQVQSQVTVTVGTGTTEGIYNPIYTYYGYNYTQQIYTSAELNAAGAVAGMQINAIRFYWTGAGSLNNCNVWTVYMGETTQSSFTSNTSWVPYASLTEVYTGTVTLPANAGWFTITLTNPVTWNGGNIVVAIDENVPGYGPSTTRWQATITANNTAIYYYADGTNPDPASPPSADGTTTTRPNIQFEMASLIPCAGDPDPGTATISSDTGCPGATITLSSTDATVGSGITYIWQSSPNPDGPWTDVPNGANMYCSTSTTTLTYYRFRVHCANSGLWGTSNVVSYSPDGDVCLCGNYPENYASSTSDEDISNITVGGWSNDSDCSTTAPGPGSINKRYANYVGTSVGGPVVMQGETVNFSLTQTSCGSGSYGNGFQLYIDWNMDGDFLDAGEQVYNQPTSASGNHTKTGTFTVPTTATPGTTRMRAVVVETSFPTSTNYAHTSYSWGETEDYCITIIPATPCDGEPTTGTASISTDVGCPGQTFTLSAPDATLAAGITYIWQSSPNPDGPWTDVPNGANMYCSTSTTTLTYYRFRVHCANSGLWGTSNVVSYSPDGDVCLCGNYPENYASSTSDEDISNITVGGWSNDSDCSTTAPGPGSINKRYANYVGTSVGGPVVMQGETVNFSLTQTSCGTYDYGNGFQLYIDWNMDGDFQDAGEQVYNQPTSASGNHTKTGTFTVPMTATPGTTRMRAVVVETTFPTSTNYAHAAYSWGETEDYCITIIPATPCDGEPTTGTASISTDVGCPGQTFTLSSTGATLAAGITYIWQSSPNPDGPWTDVPNGSNLYCSTNTFTITYYRLRIHCANSGLWATSNVVSYTPEGEVCLCGDYPALYANYTGDEEISNVTIGGWSNNSDCSTTAPGPGSINKRYSNYTGITGPTVMQGETVNFSLTQTSCGTYDYGNGFQLYIDWNMDGDFQDAGEQVYNQPTATSGNHTKTGTFTVPMTAIPGTTRMRVVNVETTFPTSTNYAHSTYGYGETEDYCITIIAAVDCNDMPVAGTATPASQVVPSGGSATITLSGSTIAAGLSYQWQRATSPTGPFTDIAGATLPSYNTGALTTSYYYRCIVTCVATGDAATSTDAFVEVIQSYNMSNTTITTCNALFYDSGGPTGNYSSSQNLILTIMPEVVGGNVIVTFNSFSTENSWDYLYIYNGNSTTAPLIGQYTGSTSPGTVTSTAADGSLTFRFTSDVSGQYAGWEALISCSDPCNYVYETPTFDQVGPFCSGWTIPDLPTTSNNGYEGTWAPAIDNTATTTYTFTPNEGECATPTTMTIVVNPNNPASFTQYSSYCRGDSIPELPTISNESIEGTWSPAINNWNTTEYTFVTNDGTCAWTTMEIEIDTVPAEIINNSGSNELNCDLTAIYLTAEGGVSYSWDGVYFNTFQGKTITDPGTYTVIVRDANSCTGEASIEITQNLNPPVATITNNTGSDYLNCHINEISLTASGGTSYAWSGGATPNSATNTFNTEGTYYVTVTADNGCDTIIYYMITDETILDITENITSPSCFGMTGSAEIIINSGGQAPFIIEWTDGVTTFSRTNIPTNTPFGYIITDADNCSTIRSLTITTPEQIQVNFVSDSVSCYGGHDGSLDISNSTGGVPPYSYQWSVAGGTGSQITGLAAGTYFVTISDAKNCTASGSHSVGQPEQISIDMQITDAICGQTGGAINAEATGGVGGFTYEWSTSSISNNITGLTPNMYTLTVTDANNCTQTASATVDKTGDIIANITVVQPILCGGNPDAILQGSSANGAMPLTFNWSNSATSEIINNLAVGTYMLTVTDAWGCTGSTEETLEAAIDVSINSNVSHVKCYGNNDGKINISIISGEPPFTIAWSNDSTELNQSSLPAGLYSVTITDNRDCAITENFEIIEPPVLELAFTKKDVSCYSDLNGTITMNVTGGTEPYTYSITTPRNQVVTNTASANNLSIGKYIMKVVDNNGCTDIKETNIYQPAKLSAKVNVTNPSCMGNDDGSIIVTPFGGTSPYRYTYDNFDLDTNIIVNAKEGRYSIEVEDANSCKLILSDIYVGDGLLPCLKIPNAFTPNGDGINETWIIENIDLYPDAQIFVYTRWGEQIYYGTPKSDPWNGTYNGKKMPTGAYLYIVETRNNDAGVYKGTVTIVY